MKTRVFLWAAIAIVASLISCNQEDNLSMYQEELIPETIQDEIDMDVYANLDESVQAIIRSLDLSMRGLPANVDEITVSPSGAINPDGEPRLAIATGSFTSAILVKAHDLALGQDLASGTITGNGMMGFTTLSIPAYKAPASHPPRVVGFSYWGSTNQWELFLFETQAPNGKDNDNGGGNGGGKEDDHIVLVTGRILAHHDALLNGHTGAKQMHWAQAMGIHTKFNDSFFYTSYPGGKSDNRKYPQTVKTGCAAYSEPGYPAGSWSLPIVDELHDIYRKRSQISNLVTGEDANYWSSSEIIEYLGKPEPKRAKHIEMDHLLGNKAYFGLKGERKYHVRCVATLK